MTLRTRDFDYELPSDRIAQTPAPQRESSRLMIVNRATGAIEDTVFAQIGDHLDPGDLLVANRSRVLPARIAALKASGGHVELLLLRALTPTRWIALARPGRRLHPDIELRIGSNLSARLSEQLTEGRWVVDFAGDGDLPTLIREAGVLPLPPYIRDSTTPPDRYQTVYADRDGSVAAPTAGLHFSTSLLESLKAQGIDTRYVTLHVGLGTFRPVTVDTIEAHSMHSEVGELTSELAESVNAVRARGGRVIAVGTTSARLLETASDDAGTHAFAGETDIFIYPGHRFQGIDALVTNFHLPRSTLLMLVSAYAGHELVMRAYRHAIDADYRFYSFGDAMLIK